MGTIVELTDHEWEQVADLFDPDVRRGAPETYPRRLMVEAMLWMCRPGVQWRYLPERSPPWTAFWSQWRRWRVRRFSLRASRASTPELFIHEVQGAGDDRP